jgi:GNAT superfamily N-acetyltransferase
MPETLTGAVDELVRSEAIVRPALSCDADQGSAVLRRSIVDLCHADHGGDAARIASWTANKTPEHWQAWLKRDDASLLVAERDGVIVGVGLVDRAGTILLNYVAPEARFTGVSTALLAAMEEISRQRGDDACTLESTRTAERFYLARGYTKLEGQGSATLVRQLRPSDNPKEL